MDKNFEKVYAKIHDLDVKIEKVNGKIDTLEQKIYGEFKSMRLWMKVIVSLMILGMTMFSPNTIQIIKLFK